MIRYYVNIVFSGPREKERFEPLYRDLLANRQEFDRTVIEELANVSLQEPSNPRSNDIPDYRTLMDEALNSRPDFGHEHEHEQVRFETMIRIDKEDYPDRFPTPNLF